MNRNPETVELRELARLLEVIRNLRKECPWDREQSVASISRNVIEEAYETADAIGTGNNEDIAEELGDLLSQALFAATIAADESRFTLTEVARRAADKLVWRHPHIYPRTDAPGIKADTAEQVLSNWDSIKAAEKENRGKAHEMRETGRALPALMRAEKLGEKARRRGMDWANAREVLRKVREELDEIEAALDSGDETAAAAEIGDMMLALANVPRFLEHNAEESLRRACDKFVGRFERLEKLAESRGLELKELTPEQVEALWQEIKHR